MVYSSIIQSFITRAIERNGFERVLDKVKVLTANEGKLTVEMKVLQEHTNPMGTMHGGFAATLVDVISSYALSTHPKLNNKITENSTVSTGVSVDMHISYLRAAKQGEELLAYGNTIKAGRTLAFLEVQICNKESGDILVKGSHTKFIG